MWKENSKATITNFEIVLLSYITSWVRSWLNSWLWFLCVFDQSAQIRSNRIVYKQGDKPWVSIPHCSLACIRIAELTCPTKSRVHNENFTMRNLPVALQCPDTRRLMSYRARKDKRGWIINRISFDDGPNTNSSVSSLGVLNMYLMLVDSK